MDKHRVFLGYDREPEPNPRPPALVDLDFPPRKAWFLEADSPLFLGEGPDYVETRIVRVSGSYWVKRKIRVMLKRLRSLHGEDGIDIGYVILSHRYGKHSDTAVVDEIAVESDATPALETAG